MPKTNSKTIQTLKQKIAAGRCKLQNLYNARGCTDADGIFDAES